MKVTTCTNYNEDDYQQALDKFNREVIFTHWDRAYNLEGYTVNEVLVLNKRQNFKLVFNPKYIAK